MALENDIQELTKAVLALTYALNQSRAAQIAEVAQSSFVPDTSEVVREREQEIVKEEIAASKKQVKSKPTIDTSQTSEPESVAVKYEDVSRLVIAISKQSVPKAKAALSRLGVSHGKGLKEEQWPEAVAYLTRVEAGEVDPEDSHE